MKCGRRQEGVWSLFKISLFIAAIHQQQGAVFKLFLFLLAHSPGAEIIETRPNSNIIYLQEKKIKESEWVKLHFWCQNALSNAHMKEFFIFCQLFETNWRTASMQKCMSGRFISEVSPFLESLISLSFVHDDED